MFPVRAYYLRRGRKTYSKDEQDAQGNKGHRRRTIFSYRHYASILCWNGNNVNRIGPTAKGNKRITASQLPEEDPDLELLFHEKLHTSPALSAAKVLLPTSHRALLYVLFDCECQLVVVMFAWFICQASCTSQKWTKSPNRWKGPSLSTYIHLNIIHVVLLTRE